MPATRTQPATQPPIKLPPPSSRTMHEAFPKVMIQLPMYNEEAVCDVIIDNCCKIKWPRDRLIIQVGSGDRSQHVQVQVQAANHAWPMLRSVLGRPMLAMHGWILVFSSLAAQPPAAAALHTPRCVTTAPRSISGGRWTQLQPWR